MGLARDLSMGANRPRPPQPGTAPIYRTLKRLTAKADLTAGDLAELRAAVEQVASGPRLRPTEGRIWVAASTRYTKATGEKIGPHTTWT